MTKVKVFVQTMDRLSFVLYVRLQPDHRSVSTASRPPERRQLWLFSPNRLPMSEMIVRARPDWAFSFPDAVTQSQNQTVEDPASKEDPVTGPVQLGPPLDGVNGCIALQTAETHSALDSPALLWVNLVKQQMSSKCC